MRARISLLVIVATLVAAPAANAAPPVLDNGRYEGSVPPAPPFLPASIEKSFKIEVLGM